MKIVHSDHHRLHFPRAELYGGELVTPFERPSRVEYVLECIADRGLGPVQPPAPLDMAAVRQIHTHEYLTFLESAWREWTAAGFRGEIIPCSIPARRMRQIPPRHIDGKVGYYAMAAETSITAGTWKAAGVAAAVAQTAQRLVTDGSSSAFALCRPPGHHAASDLFGGYCFLNNAAIAARMFRDAGASRVAILDVDFHHGNGTQDIFYDSGDVLFCSLHGEPGEAFPYFLGYADEIGTGEGEGANRNYPLPPGTGYARWSEALDDAIAHVLRFGAQALVVSLGVDTFKDDPISFFKLESDDYLDCGRRIAGSSLPTLFVMEGGYAIEAIGLNTVNVLLGFLDG